MQVEAETFLYIGDLLAGLKEFLLEDKATISTLNDVVLFFLSQDLLPQLVKCLPKLEFEVRHEMRYLLLISRLGSNRVLRPRGMRWIFSTSCYTEKWRKPCQQWKLFFHNRKYYTNSLLKGTVDLSQVKDLRFA